MNETPDYQKFALTELPGVALPFYPSMKSSHFAEGSMDGDTVTVRYKFETVIRIKAKDGLYRDIICRREWENRFIRKDADMQLTIEATLHAAEVAITEFGKTKELFIADEHEPSPYQMDETERLRLMYIF